MKRQSLGQNGLEIDGLAVVPAHIHLAIDQVMIGLIAFRLGRLVELIEVAGDLEPGG